MPKLKESFNGLLETIEVLSDGELMKSIQASQKDLEENRVLSYKKLLQERSIDEKEL